MDIGLASFGCMAHTLQLAVLDGVLSQHSIVDVEAAGRNRSSHCSLIPPWQAVHPVGDGDHGAWRSPPPPNMTLKPFWPLIPYHNHNLHFTNAPELYCGPITVHPPHLKNEPSYTTNTIQKLLKTWRFRFGLLAGCKFEFNGRTVAPSPIPVQHNSKIPHLS